MDEDLDHLLRRLAATDLARSTDLTPSVLASIAQRREAARWSRTLAPVRAAAIGFAAAIGVAAGGLAAANTVTEPRQLGAFSEGAQLAPSTLLEGRG